MKVIALIKSLRAHQVIPKLHEGSLKLSGKTSILPAELLQSVKEHKEELISFLQKQEVATRSVHISPIPEANHYPLSNAQKRIWVLSQFDGGGQAYNIFSSFIIKGVIEAKALEEALRYSIDRHESLRTAFMLVDDEPVQVIAGSHDFSLEHDKVTSEATFKKEIKRIESIFNSHVFDLEKAPLFRVKLVRITEDTAVLMFNIHHLISDGWSMGVLIQELMATYQQLLAKKTPGSQPLSIHYKEYTAWLQGRLAGEYGREARAFWQNKSLGDIESINLPTDYQRQQSNTFKGDLLRFYFEKDTYHGIEATARQQNTTVFNVFRAALSLALHTWTRQDTVVIGTPVAGRTSPQLANQIGLYVNTLPLVSHYDPQQTCADFIKTIASDSLESFRYEDYPLDWIIEDAGIERDTARNPLFDVMLVVQNTAIGDGSINIKDQAGFTMNFLDTVWDEEVSVKEGVTAKFDMSFTIAVDPDGRYYLDLEYKNSLFKRASISTFYSLFERILTQLGSASTQAVSTLSLVSREQESLLLTRYNEAIALPFCESLPELLLNHAWKDPSRAALLYGEQEMSYATLLQKAQGCAVKLAQYDTPAIGLLMSRGEEMMISLLGIVLAGKTYVPIDIKYPAERVNYILTDAEVDVLIADEQGQSFAGVNYPAEVILTKDLFSGEPTDFAPTAVPVQDTAYLIYTSGSTGKPKGVKITHQNVVSFLRWSLNEFADTPYEVMYAATSYCFDLSVFEMFLPLLQGRSIRILEAATAIEAQAKKDSYIFINTVPSVVNSLLEEQFDWTPVVALNMAGEAVPRAFKQLLDYHRMEVRNLYGPSEDTTYSTFYRFAEDALDQVPIGHPVADTHAYILDEHQRLLPPGMQGELCLSGNSVAAGYLGRPALTEEKFIQNPFFTEQRLYRTGDLCKWADDGQLLFLGRLDDQVKVRGYRIELGEVAHQIEQIAGVRRAVAIATELNRAQHLVAYYEAENQVSTEDLQQALAKKLPAYMIPTVAVRMETLPLNNNGKINKKKLPAPQQHIAPEEVVTPKNEDQQALYDIWSLVLDRTDFGVTQNFFALGGHSLKLVKLKNLIYDKFQKEVSFNELFSYNTIRAQEELIVSKGRQEERVIVASQDESGSYYPLSFAQERLWTLTQFEDVSQAYHMPVAFKITGVLDKELFNEALLLVIEKHEALRTLFKMHQGTPHQYIATSAELDFGINEYTLAAGESLSSYLTADWQQPFDLENGPLLRCTIIIKAENRYLSFTMHHMISDGWSVGVLLREVSAAYKSLLLGDGGILQPLEIQYKDFAVWQRQHLTDAVLEGQLSYWKNTVFQTPASPLELPIDRPRPVVKSYHGASISTRMSAALSQRLHAYAIEEGLSLYMVLVAQVNILLKKLSNQEDIVMGTPVAGRDSSQLQKLIGFFVNTVPIRTQVSGDSTFREFTKMQRATLLDAFDNQHFPFELLVESLQVKRDTSRSPLFDVMVVHQGFDEMAAQDVRFSDHISFEPVNQDISNTKYDLTFSFAQAGEELALTLEYNTDLFDEQTASRFVDYLGRIMELSIAAPSQKIAMINPLDGATKEKVLNSFNKEAVAYPEDATIVSLFEAVAAVRPDRTALKFMGAEMSYGQLDERSGQLARHLHEQGLRHEDFVVLHLDRSLDMLVAVLAVLKAGGVYVPVDSTYPQSRKDFILQDADARWVIGSAGVREALGHIDAQVQVIDISTFDYTGEKHTAAIHPAQLAYVIYTSGTTGNPKGVLIEHRNVVRLLFNEQDLFDFGPQDQWTLYHSYCFDFSVWEMYGALLKGGLLHIIPRELAQDSLAFFEYLSIEQITVLNMTPSAFRSMELSNRNKLSQTPLALRYVIFGGEALAPAQLEHWHTAYPACQLINMYGITETTVHVTYKEITAEEIRTNCSNIGLPIPTLSCYVLDQDMQLSPVGVTGELCVGGLGVARGYHERPELTAERFVPNPMQGQGRLYKSGDFARLLPNGEIEYIGRKDDQVKIRGHRIELPEIKEAIIQLPQVVDAEVITVRNAQQEYELVAYLILQEGEPAERELMKKQLSGKLPAYMLPGYYQFLEAWPLTSNGKLDKAALPDHKTGQQEQAAGAVPARNELDQALIEIWQEVLDREQIGIDDDFFDLGGHSLKATMVIATIQERYGIKIDIKNLFTEPTIRSLSDYLETLLWMDGENDEDQEVESGEIIL